MHQSEYYTLGKIGEYKIIKQISQYQDILFLEVEYQQQKFLIKQFDVELFKNYPFIKDLVQNEVLVHLNNYYLQKTAALQEIEDLNVIKFFEIVKTQNNWNIVLEYCDNGNLQEHFLNNPCKDQSLALQYLWQMIRGLNAIHSANYLHCDLQPEFIFINQNNQLKLGELGICKKLIKASVLEEPVKIHIYSAPELIFQKPYDYKVDIWSLGCIFFFIITGGHLFQAKSKAELISEIQLYCLDDFQWEKRLGIQTEKIDPQIRNLMSKMLQQDPAKRCSVVEILQSVIFKNYFPENLIEIQNMNQFYASASLPQYNENYELNQVSIIQSVLVKTGELQQIQEPKKKKKRQIKIIQSFPQFEKTEITGLPNESEQPNEPQLNELEQIRITQNLSGNIDDLLKQFHYGLESAQFDELKRLLDLKFYTLIMFSYCSNFEKTSSNHQKVLDYFIKTTQYFLICELEEELKNENSQDLQQVKEWQIYQKSNGRKKLSEKISFLRSQKLIHIHQFAFSIRGIVQNLELNDTSKIIQNFLEIDCEKQTLEISKKCMRLLIPSLIVEYKQKARNNNNDAQCRLYAKNALRLICIATFKYVFDLQLFNKHFTNLRKHNNNASAKTFTPSLFEHFMIVSGVEEIINQCEELEYRYFSKVFR